MDAKANEQAKETLLVVLHALKFLCYFVFFVTVDVVQKLAELAKDYMNKQQGAPVPAKTSSNPNYESIKLGTCIPPAPIKVPANQTQKAAIRDPQYQTLCGLPDDIFKKKE